MPFLFAASALLPEGWSGGVRVQIEHGTIVAVQTEAEPAAGDERCDVLVPGMPNLHSHAFQRAMAGLAERRGPGTDDFWSWREAMYRTALAFTPEDLQAVAAFLYVEMLEAGFTRVGEFHYLHHDPAGMPYADPAEMGGRIAAAAESAGIGLTLLPVLYRHGGFGGRTAQPEQRRFLCDLDLYARLLEGCERHTTGLPGAVVGVAPHSLRAVSPEELAYAAGLRPGRPVHIHVAEQVKEVEDSLAFSGRRPVEWLLDHAPVDANWCLIHATHMTEAETSALARSQAVAGLCPVTEANLGDGTFNAPDFLAARGRFGVGSDSNVLIGLGDELRQLEYSQRLLHRRRNSLGTESASTGRVLFEGALAGGAQALGAPGGGIKAGAPADLVALDASHPALIGRAGDALLDAWIFAGARAVASVWVGGREVVESGRHVAREALLPPFTAAMRRIAAS